MKITQETNEFKPITIVLETREEAKAFHDIFSLPNFGENVEDEGVLSTMYNLEDTVRKILYES